MTGTFARLAYGAAAERVLSILVLRAALEAEAAR